MEFQSRLWEVVDSSVRTVKYLMLSVPAHDPWVPQRRHNNCHYGSFSALRRLAGTVSPSSSLQTQQPITTCLNTKSRRNQLDLYSLNSQRWRFNPPFSRYPSVPAATPVSPENPVHGVQPSFAAHSTSTSRNPEDRVVCGQEFSPACRTARSLESESFHRPTGFLTRVELRQHIATSGRFFSSYLFHRSQYLLIFRLFRESIRLSR